MEKIMSLFEYEPLILSPKPKTLDEAGPSSTRVVKELGNLKGGKDSLEREVAKQTLRQ
jgi:hypothetical protein